MHGVLPLVVGSLAVKNRPVGSMLSETSLDHSFLPVLWRFEAMIANFRSLLQYVIGLCCWRMPNWVVKNFILPYGSTTRLGQMDFAASYSGRHLG